MSNKMPKLSDSVLTQRWSVALKLLSTTNVENIAYLSVPFNITACCIRKRIRKKVAASFANDKFPSSCSIIKISYFSSSSKAKSHLQTEYRQKEPPNLWCMRSIDCKNVWITVLPKKWPWPWTPYCCVQELGKIYRKNATWAKYD